jgi:hypothetical protein
MIRRGGASFSVPLERLQKQAPMLAKMFDPSTGFAQVAEYDIPDEFGMTEEDFFVLQGLLCLDGKLSGVLEIPDSVARFLDFIGAEHLLKHRLDDHEIYLRALTEEDRKLEWDEFSYRSRMGSDQVTQEETLLLHLSDSGRTLARATKLYEITHLDGRQTCSCVMRPSLSAHVELSRLPTCRHCTRPYPRPCPAYPSIGLFRDRDTFQHEFGPDFNQDLKFLLNIDINWSVFFLAGGSLACWLTQDSLWRHCASQWSPERKSEPRPLSWNGICDLDFFLITRDQDQAEQEIRNMIQLLHPIGMSRTKHAVTLYTHHLPPIQIILRLYHSRQQVLSGFDLDSCTVGFDGSHLVFLPRFERSLQTMTNYVNPERQSRTYVQRLFKYMLRGFRLVFPGLREEHVYSTHCRHLLNDFSGRYRPMQLYAAERFYQLRLHQLPSNTPLQQLLALHPAVWMNQQSDYATEVHSDPVRELRFHQPRLRARDHIQFLIDDVLAHRRQNIHIATNADDLLQIDLATTPTLFENWNHLGIVPPRIEFIKDMPHGQCTGSFHPTQTRWFQGYLY